MTRKRVRRSETFGTGILVCLRLSGRRFSGRLYGSGRLGERHRKEVRGNLNGEDSPGPFHIAEK